MRFISPLIAKSRKIQRKRISRKRLEIARQKIETLSPPFLLNLGCGHAPFEGWTNVDIDPTSAADVVLDITESLPFENNSCVGLYNEHFLEHLSVEQGLTFLKECRRILAPGGTIRIAMPDLATVIKDYSENSWRTEELLKWPELRGLQTGAEFVNVAMRWWGHQWLYDRPELHRRLKESGFTEIRDCAWGESVVKELSGRETRSETRLICEAVK